MIEIVAEDPYTDLDLNWGDESSRVVKEHESADSPAESSVRPTISNLKTIKNAVISAKTKWLAGKNFYNTPSQKTVDKWIKTLKY